MESTNLSKSNYVSSYDSKLVRLGQGVGIKFSQGSGTSNERVEDYNSFTLTLTRVQGSK